MESVYDGFVIMFLTNTWLPEHDKYSAEVVDHFEFMMQIVL